MLKEIEIKYFAGTDVSVVKESVLSLGGALLGVASESDVYYTSAHKDFIASEECLRIRTRDGKSELTWKPSTTARMREERQYWKREVNVDVGSQALLVRELLQGLDFVEYVEVVKERTTFRIDDATVVVVDAIANLGVFVEIETMSEDEAAAVLKNAEIAKRLGLGSQRAVGVPYRDLVKAGRVYWAK